MNAAGCDVDEKQDVAFEYAAARPDFLRQEVAGPEGLGVALDELVPALVAEPNLVITFA